MKCRLGQIQSTDVGAVVGVGFNIANERGPPIVTFGYLDEKTVANARALIEEGDENAALIAAAER